MRLLNRLLSAALLGGGIVSAAVAAPANWKLYVPGAHDADPKRDAEAAGFFTTETYGSHFSFIETDDGKKVLLLNTLDGKNDVIGLPLSGKEKKVTLIFKAHGDVNPDSPATPYGVLWAGLQNNQYQSVLRHNTSNQIKGSTGQTSLKPDNVVSDWHEFRLVFDTADGVSYTATAFIDGKQRHQTENYKKEVSDLPDAFSLKGDGSFAGKGNYIVFGENDNSTSGFARYAYILVITDEDVSGRSLAQLSASAGYDLAATPKITKDVLPPSHRPPHKPSSVNMAGGDFPEMENPAGYKDPALIEKGTISINSLPYSKARAHGINVKPKLPKVKFAATVNAKLKKDSKNKFSTIAAAIEAVEPGSYIKVMPGTYNEKLLITKPGIKLIGTNPAKTIIYGYEADTGGIDGNILVEVNLLPEGTNTEPGAKQDGRPAVDPDSASFSAVNITFYNKGAEWNKVWGYTERRSIALALKGAQKTYLENCIFLGQQDTLYFRSGRVYARNCYIEGEVDFICGGATALFDSCHIYSLFYANGGYITAAAPADTANDATAEFGRGYVFKDCLIDADKRAEENPKKVYLGRGAWTGGSATAGKAIARSVFINCQLGKHIDAAGWLDWDKTNTIDKAFFREYKNSGEGSVSAATASRKFLTDAEYEEQYSSAEKILGYTPEL